MASTQSQVDAAVNATNNASGQLVPTGTPFMWLTDTAPAGYVFANGQAISRTTYAALFAVFSTTFGAGDGSTTFNVPDMREAVPFGKSTMGGTTSKGLVPQYTTTAVGALVGEGQHTLATAEIPAHNHPASSSSSSTSSSSSSSTSTVHDPSHYHPYTASTSGSVSAGPSGYPIGQQTGDTSSAYTGITVSTTTSTTTTTSTSTTTTIRNPGGGGGHNNVQPSFVVNFIIKT
jgi:microcystin-dependent protein